MWGIGLLYCTRELDKKMRSNEAFLLAGMFVLAELIGMGPEGFARLMSGDLWFTQGLFLALGFSLCGWWIMRKAKRLEAGKTAPPQFQSKDNVVGK